MNTNTPDCSEQTPHANLFARFIKELQLWCRTGKEPAGADQDMRYYLDLQEKRLKEHNLQVDRRFEPDGKVYSSYQVMNSIPLLNAANYFSRFRRSTYFQFGNETVSYYRDSKEIYSKNKTVTMYQTIIDPEPGDRHVGETSYICPNCGAISTVKTLQEEGCPYCGTRFIMKDLYPKVTNYYCLENNNLDNKRQKRHKRIVWGGAALVSLFFTLQSVSRGEGMTALSAVMAFVLGSLISALAIHLCVSLFYLGGLIVGSFKSVGVTGASAGTKRKITNRLSQYNPSFSYEYFEGKALSLARMILFHDDLSNCVQYKGKDLSNQFAELIDVQYRGGMGVQSIRANADRIEVVLNLYLTDTIDNGKKITVKNETVRIWMYHNVRFPVDPAFSIRKVQCPCCGASFDARTIKACPYCHQEYDAGINDWVVTRIER